jgi:MFS family permease
VLIFTQALFFNLVYYQYPDILAHQFELDQAEISLYMLPLSAVSFVSTLFVGPYFDTIGRRKLLLLTCNSPFMKTVFLVAFWQ